MNPKTKNILKKTLEYGLMSIVLILTYIAISFLLDWIFGWFGGENAVIWIYPIAGCIVCTASIIIVDIIKSRKNGQDRSAKIIKICRQILTSTTYMFCGCLVIEWLIQRFSDKDFSLGLVHWLSFSFAVAILDQFIERHEEKKIQEDENALVIAAEYEDTQTAADICYKLESNGIKAMVVDKDSPIFIKNGDAPVQIQVCRKDLLKANETIKII